MPLQLENPFFDRGSRNYQLADPGSIVGRGEQAPYAAVAGLVAANRQNESAERVARTRALADLQTQGLKSYGDQLAYNMKAFSDMASTAQLAAVRKYEADAGVQTTALAYGRDPTSQRNRMAGTALSLLSGLPEFFAPKPRFGELPDISRYQSMFGSSGGAGSSGGSGGGSGIWEPTSAERWSGLTNTAWS